MDMAILYLTTLGLSLGLILGIAARYLRIDSNPLVDEIEAMMPGSQCGQCGYPGCAPAAAALAAGEASPTLCPPGGRDLAQRLADKLGIKVDLSLMEEDTGPILARVHEENCIGCTRCFKVCPTDAIIGAPKQIHSVFKAACTGCKACIEVCPTECLQIEPVTVTLGTWHWPKPALAA